jgi:hypothetical protein
LVPPQSLALIIIPFSAIRRAALAILVVSTTARAQATQTVPPDDPVYAFVDRLVAARLVDTVLVGQRVMSRREIGRILARARDRAGESGWLAERIRDYAAAFPETLRAAPLATSIEADAVAMDSPSRSIDSDANGAIDVRLNPFASNQLGARVANGGTYSLVASVSGGVRPWLAVAVRERSAILDERGGLGAATQTRWQQAYARALWKNVAASAGRDFLFFGQGTSAGLTSSLNQRGMDQVRLGSDRPFVLPWVFRLAGPVYATAMLADLGPRQFFPHTRFFTYKASARPHPSFEIGSTFAETVGGEGAPGGTFLQKAGDALPILDGVILHRRSLFSNKFVGVDLRYTIPGLRGAQFYAEGAFDDFDLRRVRSVFTEDAGYVWGLSESCFRECGPVRVSAEYHVTGLRYYTHGAFRSGFTVDQMIIGDQLGPRGKGAYSTVDLDHGSRALEATAAYEVRSGDKYGATSSTTDDSDFRFVLVEHHPAERRWRGMTTMRFGGLRDQTVFRLSAGVERVENFAHVGDAWRTNWMARVGVEVRPTMPFF